MRLLFIFVFSAMALSCSSHAPNTATGTKVKTVSAGTLASNEGFYSVDDVNQRAPGLFDRNIKNTILQSTGAIYVAEAPKKWKAEELAKERERRCSEKKSALWNSEFCSQTDSCLQKNKKSCALKNTKRLICAGPVFRHQDQVYAATSHHCLFHPALSKNSKTYFRILENPNSQKTLDFAAHLMDFPIEKYPYGLALYHITQWPKDRPTGEISSRPLEKNEPIVQAGFPYLVARDQFHGDYNKNSDGLRVSLGKIVEPNTQALSFCLFTADIDLTQPESWKLAKNCPSKAELMQNEKYAAVLKGPAPFVFPREERDPFLANTDMINGMSGGPAFDQFGKIVGIGSTVLKNGLPLNYSPAHPAAFSKAKHVFTLLHNK